MEAKQNEKMESRVSQVLQLLLEIKEKDYNDTWTDEFNELVGEVRRRLKMDFEDEFIYPAFDIFKIKKEFHAEEKKLSGEIRKLINELFDNFGKEHRKENFYRY